MANPKDYITSNKLQKYKITFIIEEFAEDLMNICGKCMDVGCGPGDVTKDLLLPALGTNAQIIGTDISDSMIKYANKTFGDKKRLRFEVLDIETKNLPKKYISEFDHVFSFHTLQWCNDIGQAFKNIYQILRPNGTILLYIVASHDIFKVLKILAQDIRFAQYVPDTMKYIAPYQESINARRELKELLQSIGFTIYHCSLREERFSDKKSEEFLSKFQKYAKNIYLYVMASIISILPFLKEMPNNVVKEFKNVFISEYMKRKIIYKPIYDNQELILDLYKVLIVYAKKVV